jgi:hypothetical protein
MDTTQNLTQTSPNQLLPITRLLAAIIVPILLAAFIMLYLFPNDSGRLFAWPISPPMSAMMLGATYLGGAYFFTRVALAKSWRSVQLGFIPVSTFAGILGITTLLHWDKFTPGHISFILWALLYFTLPFVIAWVWRLNQRATQQEAPDSEQSIARGLRLGFGALGSRFGGSQRFAADFSPADDTCLALDPQPANRPCDGSHVRSIRIGGAGCGP